MWGIYYCGLSPTGKWPVLYYSKDVFPGLAEIFDMRGSFTDTKTERGRAFDSFIRREFRVSENIRRMLALLASQETAEKQVADKEGRFADINCEVGMSQETAEKQVAEGKFADINCEVGGNGGKKLVEKHCGGDPCRTSRIRRGNSRKKLRLRSSSCCVYCVIHCMCKLRLRPR